MWQSGKGYTRQDVIGVIEAVIGDDPAHICGRSMHGQKPAVSDVRVQIIDEFLIGVDRNEHCVWRSEEHTSELQSLMRISYAVFCLKKKRSTFFTSIKARYTNNPNLRTH